MDADGLGIYLERKCANLKVHMFTRRGQGAEGGGPARQRKRGWASQNGRR